MCIFMDDDDSEYDPNDASKSSGEKTGARRLQLRNHHTWLIPRRGLMIVVMLALFFMFLGMVLMAIGGGIGSVILRVIGGILFGLSITALVICLLVCLFAYFFYGKRDQSVQTETQWTEEIAVDVPGYASIGRPSALKSADSTLKRNGNTGHKKVTMAPDVGPYGESPPNAVQGGCDTGFAQPNCQHHQGYSSSGGSGFYESSGSTGRSMTDGGVGSGGIRITTPDGSQPFPSPNSHVYQSAGGGGGQRFAYGSGSGQAVYSGGGSSASSSIDTYAFPKGGSLPSGQSGFSESSSRSYHGSNYDGSGSGSQYSTIKSIPVTHIVSENSNQQKSQQETVEYARVNKPVRHVQTIDIPAQRSGEYAASTSSIGSSTQIQNQSAQFQQGIPANLEDFDYDNPVDRTPMLPPKQGQSHNKTYHERQMQYQRQIEQRHPHDIHAPRQLNTHSLQREYARNPYMQQEQQLQQQQTQQEQLQQQLLQQQQQTQQEQLQQQLLQQQQQQQYQYQSSQSTSRKSFTDDDLPEPQPLVYPSARRPMTFEQISSSKMSMYDNVLSGGKDHEEEEEE